MESEPLKTGCDNTSCLYLRTQDSYYRERVISISCSKNTYFLRSTEISYIKADGHSVDIHRLQKPVLPIFNTMKYFESIMEPPFYRVHKSFMVNALTIYRINWVKRQIWINELNTPLPYSISYAENVHKIEEWLKDRKFST